MGFLNSILGNKKDTAQAPVAQSTPSKGKILIVEDEKSLSDALEMKLKSEGFEVLTAADGQIGLDMTVANKPNVILLDLMMPVMNGEQMLQKLRAIPEFKTLPVIVLTNAGSANNMQDMKLYYGISQFLNKSNISMQEIAEKVKAMIILNQTPTA